MNNLNDLREEIDRIDVSIQQLFEERMGVAKRIAADKARSGTPVYDPAREEALFEKMRQRASDEEMGEYIVEWYRALMEISRRYQTGRINSNETD